MDTLRAMMHAVIRAALIGFVLYCCSLVYFGEAHAQTNTCPQMDAPSLRPCDQGRALSAAKAFPDALAKCHAITGPGGTVTLLQPFHTQNAVGDGYYTGTAGCYFNGQLQTNVTQFPPMYYGSTCLTSPVRANLSSTFSYGGPPPTCIEGCEVSNGPYTMVTVNGSSESLGSERAYTGDVCEAVPSEPVVTAPEAEEPAQEQCVAAGHGQTFCLKPDGQQCTTSSTGKEFCWSADQQGAQVDPPDAQTKLPDGKPVAPPSTVIDDQEWDRGNGHQTTTCVNSTCATYNVTNWSSVPTGTGDPGDGGGEESSEGAGDGDEGNGFGNPAINCKTPPSCGGKDAIGCAMLKQHYNLTCKASDESGTDGVPEGPADADVMADPATIFGEGTGPGEPDIDFGGWAATGQCPVVLSFSIPRFGSYTMDGEWICHVLDVMRSLINLLAAIHAGFIVAGGLRKG